MEKSKIKDKNDKHRINIEIKILKNSFHFNIIKLYEVIETEDAFFLIMEYAEGGDLSSYLMKKKYLNENEARKIFQQIIDTVYYLHQIGVCHRNLRLENILFSSKKKDIIKIINFGRSNLYLTGVSSDNPALAFGAEFLETPFENLLYTPPEMILGVKYDGLLLDIWMCGIILYAMLFGSFPFEDKNTEKLYSKIIKGEFIFPKNINITKEAQSLLNKILVVNPRLRSNINDIRTDAWFMKDYEPTFGLYISIREIPISDKIIEQMEKNGMKKNEIIKEIKNNRHNDITTYYYILVNKFRNEGIETKSDLNSDEFNKYLREQDLKNNLIKKGEKPISLKIMKSKSNSFFNLNESNNKDSNKDVDLDYLKKIFQDYNIEEQVKNKQKNNINETNIHPQKSKKKNLKSEANSKKSKTEKRISKSQNAKKKVDKKYNNIHKDRYSYSTSLNKRNNKRIKDENNKKLLYKNNNIIMEKDETKHNNKIKQIINIKEIIKIKNKTVITNDEKKLLLEEPKINHRYNHLVLNSTSFTSKNKNSLIINKNIFNINNDSKSKLDKIKKLKEKNINIKNLSLKNKFKNNHIYRSNISSRNNLDHGLNKEFRTSRDNRHKYFINSSSNSKSKSLNSKSNYSTRRCDRNVYKDESNSKKKNKYFNIKINAIKPSILYKEKTKSKEKKSKSASKSKDLNKNNKSLSKQKNSKKSNKKNKDNNTKLKNEIIFEQRNSSKKKSNNNIKFDNNIKIQNINKSKERKNQKRNNINKIERHLTSINCFKFDIKNDNKYKNNDKIFSNTLKKLIPKKKEIIPAEKKYIDKNSINYLINQAISSNKRRIEITKQKNKNKVINSTYTNSNIKSKRQYSNKITNIKRTSPKNESKKKEKSSSKNKIKEIKSIKIFNIPIKDIDDIDNKTDRYSENRKCHNILEDFHIKKDIKMYKNRFVLNNKNFNNI